MWMSPGCSVAPRHRAIGDAVSALTGGTGVPSRPTSYLSTVDGLDTDHPRRPYRVTVEELARFDQARRGQRATIGFDVTFSAPKSVSVLWAVADPGVEAAILDSIHAAVQAGMRYLEQQAIACRIRGTVTQGDGLLAAGYLHATNRNLDPQLHWHVVVANMTTGTRRQVRALDGRQLYLHAKTAGFLASAELRHQLTTRLGVGVGGGGPRDRRDRRRARRQRSGRRRRGRWRSTGSPVSSAWAARRPARWPPTRPATPKTPASTRRPCGTGGATVRRGGLHR